MDNRLCEWLSEALCGCAFSHPLTLVRSLLPHTSFVPAHRWVGVLASYLLRPSPQSAARHAEVRRSFGSTTNNNNIVVGVHIRRSDKVAWGRSYLHVVEEYMTHVERYCDWRLGPDWWVKKLQHEKQQAQMLAEQQHKQEQADQVAASGAESGASPPGCVVYLASDEPAVLEEMREYYPHIQVVANPLGLETGEGRCCLLLIADARGGVGPGADVACGECVCWGMRALASCG